MNDRIVRSLCAFTDRLDPALPARLDTLAARLTDAGFTLQTQRICVTGHGIAEVEQAYGGAGLYLSVGGLDRQQTATQFDAFLAADNVAFNLELGDAVEAGDGDWLQRIIRERPEKGFSFAYTACNAPGSPFFPSASWAGNGFAIGLQPTDLAAGCATLDAWLARLATTWDELVALFDDTSGFLGIDGSIAPLFDGPGSLLGHIARWHGPIERAATSDTFLRITRFLQTRNPRPTGLNGIMFPCLEDFVLADDYARGAFDIERNLFLSLHSGLGIDTYPLGIDEPPARVEELLRLLHGLATKYDKPLSARFVSDGRARIGERSDFGNPFLKDVILRPL